MRGTISRARKRLILILAAVTATVAGLGVLAPMAASAAGGCEVDYQVQHQWPGGFTAKVDVTNLGEAIDGWTVKWSFASGQQVTQAWNADITATGGQVTAKNVSYNRSIASNASTSFGFNGSWTQANPVPSSFTLNGVTCDGTVGEPSTPPTTTPPPTGGVSAMDQVAAMQPGWNVGNTLDALGGETAWGNPMITEQLLQTVKAEGFNSIRLPVTWDENLGPAPDYTIDQAWLDRVAQVIDWALENDLQVLLNIHHDSWMWMSAMPTDHDGVLAKYDAIWTQLADRFKDYPAELSFESVNEPQFTNAEGAAGDAFVDELNRSFHEIVRDSGGGNADRLLVMPTLFTNADQARLDALKATIDDLDDPMVAATIHFYGFWPFSVNIAGFTTYNAEVEADLVGTFQRVNDTFVDADIPVIMGEWAVLNYDHNRPGVHEHGELMKFFEAAEFQARDKDVTTMLWDAGQFLNRNTLQWRDPHIYSYFEAGWTSRSGTASFDQVHLPKTGTIPAKTLTLNPNGTTFRGLWQGNTQLAQGTDYTVSGNTLTLTSTALTRLAGNRAYGTNSTIEARFSAGVPWQISVITSSTPVLSNATGPSASFAVPTQFNGNQLATMEAKYADGSNAGTATWTSYQEFWSNFRPDYNAGTLLLTPEFLAAVTDGQPVTLTFHFQSGATATYTITESGGTVTGTTA